MRNRTFVTVNKDMLPRQEDRHPFLYFERSKIVVDDGSIKVLSAENGVFPIPVAMVANLLLGPGCSITTEAVRTVASVNCSICWVGEDSFRFYAGGRSPTDHTKSSQWQLVQYCEEAKRLEVARRMFRKRFPADDLTGKTLKQMMGMEGSRVKSSYVAYSVKYGVEWSGRNYNFTENALGNAFVHGDYIKESGDTLNRTITAGSQALYALVHSFIYSLGFLPQVGFIHSGSPLPFVYDIADLYKDKLVVETSFRLVSSGALTETFSTKRILEGFSLELSSSGILRKIPEDIWEVLGRRYGSADS